MYLLSPIAIIMLGGGCSTLQMNLRKKVETVTTPELITIPMHIESSAFRDNGPIPSTYTCDGEDKNPPLTFSEVPEEAKSLVLIVDDPDAPGGDWSHWVMWNIPTSTTQIDERRVPTGAVEGTTDFGKPGYGGPCPPSGTHRYQFKLYALDIMLSLLPSANKQMLEKAIDRHIIAHARVTGLYQRSP